MGGQMEGWINEWVDVCMYAWMDGWMVGWMDGWMDADGWMDGWVGAWIDRWMNTWMAVHDSPPVLCICHLCVQGTQGATSVLAQCLPKHALGCDFFCQYGPLCFLYFKDDLKYLI